MFVLQQQLPLLLHLRLGARVINAIVRIPDANLLELLIGLEKLNDVQRKMRPLQLIVEYNWTSDPVLLPLKFGRQKFNGVKEEDSSPHYLDGIRNDLSILPLSLILAAQPLRQHLHFFGHLPKDSCKQLHCIVDNSGLGLRVCKGDKSSENGDSCD